MLMLLFNLGDSRYAIPAREVIEIAPRVRLEPLARTPEYVAGLLNYRGDHVPVLDLCRLVKERGCSDSLTTRIILVHFAGANGKSLTLGLIAEAVTETLAMEDIAFSDTGVNLDEAPFLGEAAHSSQGLVRKLNVTDLLPRHLQTQLFADAVD
jgi:chemotaxis-related protein WspB